MIVTAQSAISIGDGSSNSHSSSPGVPFSSFVIFLRWYELMMHQKKKEKDLAHENCLKIKSEVKKHEDEYRAFCDMSLEAYRTLNPDVESKSIMYAIMMNNMDKLYIKDNSACKEYDDLNKAYANKLTEIFSIMIVICEIIPWLNTPFYKENKKQIKALYNEALRMKRRNDLFSINHIEEELYKVVDTYNIMIEEMFKLFINKYV